LPHGTRSTGGYLKIKQNERIWNILSISHCRILQEVLSMKLKGRLRSRWHNRLEKSGKQLRRRCFGRMEVGEEA
jgi:hypothetical protein